MRSGARAPCWHGGAAVWQGRCDPQVPRREASTPPGATVRWRGWAPGSPPARGGCGVSRHRWRWPLSLAPLFPSPVPWSSFDLCLLAYFAGVDPRPPWPDPVIPPLSLCRAPSVKLWGPPWPDPVPPWLDPSFSVCSRRLGWRAACALRPSCRVGTHRSVELG